MPSARLVFLLVVILSVAIIPPAFAGTETVIYNFCSLTNCADGSGPYLGNLIFDSAGNLYGTTVTGGTDNVGVVFELSPQGSGLWKETVLHNFLTNGKDGNKPYGSLVFDKNGNLYGTTTEGGVHLDGVVFELSPGANGKWTETIIHAFNDNGKDAAAPYGAPVFDSAGNLYGSTDAGGKNYLGSVYELSPGANGKWTEKILHSFADNGKDGWIPVSPVILDSSGNIYGTTLLGGSGGNGIVYELTSTNGKWTEKILHAFANNNKQGAESYGALAFNASGDLVSTTVSGGQTNNGTVYELIPGSGGKWTEKVLHSFITSRSTGEYPYANIIFDGSGNMYSTTESGGNGAQANGTIFEMSLNDEGKWTEKTLYQFCIAENCADGSIPTSGLVFDNAGSMYGTTQQGGTGGGGVVYKFTK